VGQEVLVENRELATGSNLVRLNTSQLPAGIYMVVVTTANGKAASKIIIQ
jgi:hypothetical protein